MSSYGTSTTVSGEGVRHTRLRRVTLVSHTFYIKRHSLCFIVPEAQVPRHMFTRATLATESH